MKTIAAAGLLLPALVSAACSTYNARYRYRPKPFAALVVARDDARSNTPIARALISVTGVRKASDTAPAQIEIAFLLENLSASPLSLDAPASELVTGDLERLGEPLVEGPARQPIEPGDDLKIRLFFPLPAGRDLESLDLDGLNLTWSLRLGDRTIRQTSTFERVYRPVYPMYGDYYGGFWGPPYGPYWSFGGWWIYGH